MYWERIPLRHFRVIFQCKISTLVGERHRRSRRGSILRVVVSRSAEACLTNIGFGANTWTGLQTFNGGASTTNLSVSGIGYFVTASTTNLTVSNTATLSSGYIATASSTVVGQFTAGQASTSQITSGTSWLGNTFASALNVSGNATLTNATTTNLGFTNLGNAILSTNAQGSVVATTSIGVNYINGLGTIATQNANNVNITGGNATTTYLFSATASSTNPSRRRRASARSPS